MICIVTWCIRTPAKKRTGGLNEITGIQVIDGASQSVPGIPVIKLDKDVKEEPVDQALDLFMFY